MLIHPRTLFAVAALSALGSVNALAEGRHAYLDNKHFVYLGAFDQQSDAVLMAQRDGFEPVSINFENIGLNEDYTSWMLEYHYRLSDNWKLSASAYRFTQGGGRILDRDFNYDGVDFTAGLDIRSKTTIDTYILDAMYTAYSSDNAELLVGAGIHALDTSLNLTAEASINGDLIADTQRASASVLAPLPNLRASGFYAFDERWSVWATAGWLSVNIDNLDGGFEYFHVRGQYQITSGLGFSLGYQHVGVDIEESLDNGVNLFDMTFRGATAAISYTF